MTISLRLLVVVFLWTAASAAGADESNPSPPDQGARLASVDLLDGSQVEGRLEQWSEAALVLQTDEGPRELPVDELLTVRFHADRAVRDQAPQLVLTDGSVLACDRFTATGELATATFRLTGAAQALPREAVRSIEFAPRPAGVDRLWRELDAKELVGDVLIVRKRGPQGEEPALDYLTGIVDEINGEQIQFRWDGDLVPVKLTKAAGIGFFRARRTTLPPAACQLRLRTAEVLAVSSIQWGRETAVVQTPAGVQLKVPIVKIAAADFSQGKLTYLSDLTPLGSVWTPFVGLPAGAQRIREAGAPCRDRSFRGSMLTLTLENDSGEPELQTYAKGLAIRSKTELVYAIPPEMRTFTALAGMNPATSSQGHVTLEIYAGRSLVWQGEIDGDEPPRQVIGSLEGASRLRIVVDYGDNLDFGDQLHLVEARMTK